MHHRALTIAVSLFLILGGLWAASGALAAPLMQAEAPVFIYFFWGDGCPHCAEAEPFLEELADRYPAVQIEAFEVWYDTDGQDLFGQMTKAHGFEPHYVPTIFIGDRYWEGFADTMREDIEAAVRACVEGGCPDAGSGIVPGHEAGPVAGEGSAPGSAAAGIPVALFWGDLGCDQCEATKETHITQSGFVQIGADSGAEALAFLEGLQADTPAVALSTYEVWSTATNSVTFNTIAEAYGIKAKGVPTLFIGDRVWEGFDASTAGEVSAYVQECLRSGCPGPLDEASSSTPPTQANRLTLPLLGTIDLGAQSLWVSTALISFVDGFNPCSLWVLSILIALTLRTGSRRRIFAIGLIYITVTAAVYVLFIAGLFTFLTVVSVLTWIQTVVSILALFFAVINIKDYFWYKEGLSLTISDEKKPGIYKRIRKVLNAGDSFWAMAGATVALGAGVSLVEFSCTAGFPVIWTNLVSAQGVEPLTFALLLLLYMAIYQLDELAIFGVAVLTLKSSRLEEKHGRVLKLIGGVLMLSLALVMLIKPALMNNVGSSLLVFAVALAVAAVVLIVHQSILRRSSRRRNRRRRR